MPGYRRGWANGNGPNRGNRNTTLTISLLEPALLILIKEQPRHGYTLLSDLDGLGMTTLHPSVVYRTLRNMEELEWVASDWETNQTQGPPRRTYRLTEAGKEALNNWQSELERNQEIIMDLLLRI